MQTREWRDIVDRKGWAKGPWDTEPDKGQWTDAETGLPCLFVRNPAGALCGYVGVPSGHPWHGAGTDEVDDTISVHGGVTFAGPCVEASPEDDARGYRWLGKEIGNAPLICHIPGPGEPDDVWWLGFDCAHCFDTQPKMRVWCGGKDMPKFPGEEYRDLAYVRRECADLARQAAGMARG